MANLQVGSPLTLKCGLTLPNRLVKAAMAEKMAEAKAMPGQQFKSTYGEWADGSWGMVLTGNVQVDQRYLGNAHDVAYNDDVAHDQMLQTWKAWASVCSRSGTPTLVQINHPGRQSPAGAGTRGLLAKNVTPSAVAMDFGSGWAARLISALAFGTPRAMTSSDIDDVVRRFAATARLAAEAGFAGVEIHAAHGYLLAQFLSSKTNRRTDAYGGSPAARAQIVLDVIRAVRAAVPDRFCIGIKLNSVEQQSADALRDCIEQLQLIAAAGVDFLEISGGTYEDPQVLPLSLSPSLSDPLDDARHRRGNGRPQVGPDPEARSLLPRVRPDHSRTPARHTAHGHGRLPHARRHGGGPHQRRMRSRGHRPAGGAEPGLARQHHSQPRDQGRRFKGVRAAHRVFVAGPSIAHPGRGWRCRRPLVRCTDSENGPDMNQLTLVLWSLGSTELFSGAEAYYYYDIPGSLTYRLRAAREMTSYPLFLLSSKSQRRAYAAALGLELWGRLCIPHFFASLPPPTSSPPTSSLPNVAMALNTILSPADQDTGPEGQATTGRIILSDDGSNNNNRRPGAALTAATQSAETSPDVAYFLAIPWCRAQLLPSEGRPAGSAAAREVRVVLPAARRTALRHGPAASDRWRPDYLSSRTAPGNVISTTLNSLDTIAALLVFFEEPTPSPTHSVAYRAPIVEVKALLSLGPGLSGHIGVMHGGLVATVLDEVLGLLMPLNRRRALHNQRHNEASAAAEKQQQQHDVYWGPPSGQPISPPEEAARASASVHHGLVTAYLNTTYVRPVRTCTTILATSRFVRIEGSRKFYVEGSIWDENAQLLAKAEALFVALREKL